MPKRLQRYYGAGYLHFITSSCYHRRALLGTPARRNLFLKTLEQVRRRYGFVVVGYVVMPRTFSSPHQRTGEGKSLAGDAGSQAARRTHAASQLTEAKSACAKFVLGQHFETRSPLVATVLRFRSLESAQASREIALHASQSGDARTGFRA